MLMADYTAEFLNLKDVIITNVENVSEQLHIYVELPRRKHICPVCGAVTDCVHDYQMQVVKDTPLARNTFLHLRKRRYRCSCGKRFFEKNTFLPRYYDVIRLKSSEEGRQRLVDWFEVMDLPEFYDCTKAYHNWFNEIINAMDVPWTNGYIEGCNNKTKVLKRISYGMRNFSNFRKRILFCNT